MILMKNIIREGHPTLTKKAQDVALPLTRADKQLMLDMIEFVQNSQDPELSEAYDLRPAVGIAAPQLNISRNIFAVHVHDLDGILYDYVLINPKMTILDDQEIYLPGGEGCLSVDRETEGLTPRFKTVKLEALRYDYQADIVVPIELIVSGYVGIVFQHEFDHLEGVMFTDKIFKDLPNAKPAFEIPELEKETTSD